MIFFLKAVAQQHQTQNVIIVTLDGFRWQELYRGADSALINSKFTSDKNEIRKQFWANSPEERRKKLMPFIWSALAEKGQLYGDRDLGNKDEVVNPYHFSYPGYSEIFTGFADKKINTNNPITNPNVNVLEYLSKQKGFENKVAVFSSWERFPQILNVNRSGLLVNSGYMNFNAADANSDFKLLNMLQHKAPHYLGDSTRLDFLTYAFAKSYIKEYKPKVLYLSFDETDDMAHSGNYQYYLQRANQEDGFLAELWNMLQNDDQYKDKTTLIVTCDHGRGDFPLERWKDHGFNIKNSEQTWFAVIGPDTESKGIVTTQTTTYHNQLAQTIAKLFDLDFKLNAGHEVADEVDNVSTKKLITNKLNEK